MVATIKVQEVTGESGSKVYTDNGVGTTTVRLFTKDQATNQTTPQITFPVPIPTVDYYFSYWKHVCLDIAGSFTSVTNIRHYSDGDIGWNFGSGGELRRGNRDSGDIGCPTGDYQQALGTEGTTGYAIEVAVNGHAYYNGQTTKTVNVEDDEAPNGVMVDTTGVTVAGKTKMIVLQAKVDTAANGATSGVQTAETMTWKYDVVD
jgi:hypothetical protein